MVAPSTRNSHQEVDASIFVTGDSGMEAPSVVNTTLPGVAATVARTTVRLVPSESVKMLALIQTATPGSNGCTLREMQTMKMKLPHLQSEKSVAESVV